MIRHLHLEITCQEAIVRIYFRKWVIIEVRNLRINSEASLPDKEDTCPAVGLIWVDNGRVILKTNSLHRVSTTHYISSKVKFV